MPRRPVIKKRPRRSKPAGLLVELDNRTELPSEFVQSVVSWGLAFLKRLGLKPQRKLELTVKNMPSPRRRLGRVGPVTKGVSVLDEVEVRVVTDPAAYPASGRYTTFPEFPEYRLSNVTDALVSIVVHELAHWHGVDGDREGEFLCEVLSSAAVADYRARYETGKLLL